eukprot:CAMPEP_0196587846 /NCGR_PEP_ID=MMETSP1081-20130531/58780_1 /TAXON_ID=36882 /ORGANISM="Pyramimonas amylifera, Strain CCMP720" /LENGTH=477 /DNA_ID=CAMNT_0041910151 /DNA_START=300 /DNA_END=1733 /DNA_ORIENTATION=+
MDMGEFQAEWNEIFASDDIREKSGNLITQSDQIKRHANYEEFDGDLETAYLVGAELKAPRNKRDTSGFGREESINELTQLAETAGLEVVGSTHQMMDKINPKTFVGSGKIIEIMKEVERLGVDTLIFDDELSATQGRNLVRMLGEDIRVCDRTNLILDIFSQRARTAEGKLQVELAMAEYQLPRLTKMWTHLERQAGGGQVKGMGEKQIEIDKRLLREKITALKLDLEDVRLHRQQYRIRRAKAPIPVAAIVGYTNAGKSTLLNRVSNAEVLAEDSLFATLDPTTRRIYLPQGKQLLMTDTVGFIQKLPTQLVAAFRATLEEIAEASVIIHVVDASSPLAVAQAQAVQAVLQDLKVSHYPHLTVWNKMDLSPASHILRQVAAARKDTFCISAQTGEGIEEMLTGLERLVELTLVQFDVSIPYTEGWLVGEMHQVGVVTNEEFTEFGTRIAASIPISLASKIEKLAKKNSTIRIFDLE